MKEIDRITELEQENAELKAELQKFQDMAAKGLEEFKDVGGCWGCGLQLQLNQDIEDIKQLKAEIKLLKSAIKQENYVRTFEENEKLKQTLQEIKEIAEFHITEADSEDVQEDMKQIIDLITKAEVGE